MKDKIIKYLQYDPYHGQLRVVSDLPSPQSPVSCSELQGAHHLTLLYYFVPHEPPAFVVRHTGRTLLRTGVQPTPGPSQASERGSAEAKQLDSDEEHVEDDERSWHSLHADEAHDETAEQLDEDEGLARDMDEEDWPAPASESDPDHASPELHHVRGYESLRLLSHVLVLETVSAEHSLTHLLSHQARDSSPPPVHHLSRYFRKCLHSFSETVVLKIDAEHPTPTKKRKSGGGDSTRGRKKAKK
jgi:hypothetical protein